MQNSVIRLKAEVSYSFKGGPRCETWTVDEGGLVPDGPPGSG